MEEERAGKRSIEEAENDHFIIEEKADAPFNQEGNNRYLQELEEWQNNQYNPGYYLGGKIPGNLLYHGRPKLVGALLIGIGIMNFPLFALTGIEFFRNRESHTLAESLLALIQFLLFGGFYALLIVNGIRKIINKTK